MIFQHCINKQLAIQLDKLSVVPAKQFTWQQHVTDSNTTKFFTQDQQCNLYTDLTAFIEAYEVYLTIQVTL